MSIRPAKPQDAGIISDIAFRSKAYWDYDEAFMEACREELTTTPDEIKDGQYFVLEVNGQIAGFYELGKVDEEIIEIENLFLDPAYIGKGYGKQLFQHAYTNAIQWGYGILTVVSDPNAKAFYEAMGMEQFGEYPSYSIAGRMLPHLKLDLEEES